MKVLVAASTFPASETDKAPAFVRDLVIALKRVRPDLELAVLAPHYRDETPAFRAWEQFDEYRFPYFVPRRRQGLAGRGIVPAIESNRAYVLMVPLLFAAELLALLALVRKLRPDVLYAHWFTPQGVNMAIVSALTGTPYVLTSHANDVRIWRKLPLLGRAVVRTLLPRASRITVVSALTRDKMRGFFSDDEWRALEERIAIIPMGVDVAALEGGDAPAADLKARYGYADRRVIYFVGRLASKKGIRFLIDAMRHLPHADVKLVIAGDGPLRADLEAQVRERGLDGRVDFVGYVSGQAKLDYFALADVIAVPSIETASGDTEGFPVVIMEALAAGKPCVASDASGADAILRDGENGFLVPQQDERALAAALQRALDLDPVERARLAVRAREDATQLDWSLIAERHLRFLFEPLEAKA